MNTLKLTTHRIVEHTTTIGCFDMINLLRQVGHDIPDNAVVVVQIPGDGDYSNMDLEIDGETSPIKIKYKTTEQE
jgi:hypothetical protein